LSNLLKLAQQFGGRERYGAIVVPAAMLAGFLQAADEQGVELPFFECLYLGQGFTEPSMELSRSRADFPTHEGFIAFAAEASAVAQARAQSGEGRSSADSAEAIFEVGP